MLKPRLVERRDQRMMATEFCRPNTKFCLKRHNRNYPSGPTTGFTVFSVLSGKIVGVVFTQGSIFQPIDFLNLTHCTDEMNDAIAQ